MGKHDQELYQLADDFQKQTGQRVFRASLGDANGRVDVPGYNGVMVYVRYYTATGLSQPFEVAWRAGSMTKTPGTGVIVEYDYDKSLAIKRADYPAMAAQGTNPTINNPADPNNSHFIQQMRLLTFASHPVSSAANSMLVAVQTGTVIDLSADTVTLFAGEQIDLEPEIPAGAGEWCLACLFWKTDNTIEVITSTPVTNPDALRIADVNECFAARTAGSLPIWAWRLYNGQTGIAAGAPANGGDDFMDLRPLFFMLQSGGSGSMTFDVAADSGTPATIEDGDTATFEGTGGIATSVDDVTKTVTIDGSGIPAAPPDAHYVTTQNESGLSQEFSLGSLTTGLLKHTVSTGVSTPATAAAGTDYTSPTGTENLSNKTITASLFADYWRQPVRAVSRANVSVSSAPALIDTVSLSSGDRVLLTAQSTGSQNGVWIWNGTGNAMTRPTDYPAASTVWAFQQIIYFVIDGVTGGSLWRLTTTGTITIDTTSTTWQQITLLSADTLKFITSGGFLGTFQGGSLTNSRTWTFPDAGGTVVLEAATQTLTNKSISGSQINSGTVAAARLGTMTGDTGSGGASGAAPTPATGDRYNFLRGDATYVAGAERLFAATANAAATGTGAVTLLGSGVGTLTLPANRLIAGTELIIKLRGIWTTDGTPGNVVLTASLGGTSICASPSTALAANMSNREWELEIAITCRTTGATGTVRGQGKFIGQNAANTSVTYEMPSTADVTVDTTGTLVIDVTWNNNNSGNTITCTNALVEVWG